MGMIRSKTRVNNDRTMARNCGGGIDQYFVSNKFVEKVFDEIGVK